MQMKQISLLIFILFLMQQAETIASSHPKKDFVFPSYAVHLQAGQMKFGDEDETYRVFSCALKPASGETGLGLDFFSADGVSPSRDRFSSFIATVNLQSRVFGFRFGFNVIRDLGGGEDDDGPEGMAVPVVGIRIGSQKKVYVTIEGLTDMYLCPFNWQMHYVLNDGFSNAMAGIYWGDATQDEYFGYTMQLERLFYKRIFFSL